MTIQITTSAAIARYQQLSQQIFETADTAMLAPVIEDRHRLLVAIARKAGIPPKQGWRVRTLAWMDDQMNAKGLVKVD